ncbi:MAG: hypothetical protein IPJ32_13070 [Sphingobacteriaceae bacterium]|nr:hypothetical protein [Sphingobacteriaceae bacterium]
MAMNISKKEIDKLNAEVVINLGPSDYEEKVNDAIKKFSAMLLYPDSDQVKFHLA